jgi:superfamily II DNA/RNA helicase
MALTATATPQVLEDIRMTLQLTQAPTHMGSFDRPNIYYKVRYRDALDASHPGGALADCVQYIVKRHKKAQASKDCQLCSGIVYVHKRDDTTLLAKAISDAGAAWGVRAEAYHAGLKDAQRNQVQMDWSTNKIQVVIATVAFGMGIDLAHVRYVIHWSLAKTVEGFYQESGRAGRDGLPAHSVVYFSKKDASTFAFLMRKQHETSKDVDKRDQKFKTSLEGLEKMVEYCTAPSCRRAFLLKHFGDACLDCCQKTCDYCSDPQKVERAIQSAAVLTDVLKQQKKFSQQKKNKQAWDGQWMRPHNDDGNDEDDEEGYRRDWGDLDNDVVDGLRITGPATFGGNVEGGGSSGAFSSKDSSRKPGRGFVKASSILAKYEVLECQENNSNGFFRFRSKSQPQDVAKPVTIVTIPEHLRAGLPDPWQHLNKKPSGPSNNNNNKAFELKSSAEHAQATSQLKEDLAKLQAEREMRLKALQEKQAERRKAAAAGAITGTSTSLAFAPPPPPAPLTFGSAGGAATKKPRRGY